MDKGSISWNTSKIYIRIYSHQKFLLFQTFKNYIHAHVHIFYFFNLYLIHFYLLHLTDILELYH